ncbi:family 20 glycosylhydrolase [Candidatus Symbiothrix dinenymphae]|uniref:family 20 glycosylhydrolase n=1 Tax=Candidatus Symbiothrix dinenymphae TaxID=467085 RepID=UPI0006C342CC|nr:family 20 glycosylhydrolase [Candidatus Symbiothrix dinenymphae]GAP72300.1 beta-N-acetylhexosaminidase, GH20 [Candidatus Symbiothrix dinenymphae]
MKTISKCFLAVCMLSGVNAYGNDEIRPYSILPEPQQVAYTTGSFKLKDKLTIAFPPKLANEATLCRDVARHVSAAINPILQKGQKSGDITLVLDASVLPQKPEGYILDIQSKGIVIKANAPAGILYGIQTLRQLLEASLAAAETWHATSLQCGTITDYPTLGWRALMLDESRYFHGKEAVFRLLDNMARLKLNVFQWHIVDSDGWRIEIKKYPELTKTGAHRDSTIKKGWWDVGYEHGYLERKPHGGFYTQDEIREVVAYAAARHITIVPEIEMPGHGDAAINSYPWLGVPKVGTQKTRDNLMGTYVFDVTDPKVIEFFHNVLTEVMALFPSKVIHIGGDEVHFDYWKNSPAVSQYMKEKGFKTPADLQVDFTNKMSQWLTSKKRNMMGWNEITGADVQGGNNDHTTGQRLAPGTVVQFWKGDLSLIKKAIDDGYNVVNSQHQFTYLDYTYKSLSLEKAYSFNPVPKSLTDEQKKSVLGLGCQLWTEFVPDENALNYRVYPRIAAYAEVGWTAPDKKDYKRFLKSLDYFLAEWKKQGIEYGQIQTAALDWGEKRWKDLPENPLIDPEVYGLQELVIGDPQILLPGKFDDKWHAFFHGFSHDTKWHSWFFHSVSKDGLHWADASHAEGEIGVQYIFCDGDRWIQYYSATTEYKDPKTGKQYHVVIRARTTTDFKTWSEPVTLVVPDLPKEREGPRIEARNPCVILLPDGRYRMYYSGGTVFLNDAGYEEPKNIFCAEADNPLGPFIKREEPILEPDVNLPFRNFGCGGFKVFGYKKGYVAFYNPIYIDAEGKSRSEIRLLSSDDGLQWKEADCNPIVKPDANIPWRSAIIYQLDVVHWENSLLMYFNAREGWRGGAERIGAVKLNLNGEAPAVKLEKSFNKQSK